MSDLQILLAAMAALTSPVYFILFYVLGKLSELTKTQVQNSIDLATISGRLQNHD